MIAIVMIIAILRHYMPFIIVIFLILTIIYDIIPFIIVIVAEYMIDYRRESAIHNGL